MGLVSPPPDTCAYTADVFNLIGESSVLFWKRKAKDPEGSRELLLITSQHPFTDESSSLRVPGL